MTDDDDGPSRFDTLSHALSRAQRRAIRRFGYANCAHCGHEFIKHRRDQRFCNDGCRYRSYSTLNGRLSTDPRWKLKRKRQARLAAIRQKDALNRMVREQRKEIKGLSQQVPSGKNPVGARVAGSVRSAQKTNEINGLQSEKSLSRLSPEVAVLIRQFGDAKPVTARRMASLLGGAMAPSRIAGILARLAADPVEAWRVECIEGSGNDAVWRIVPVQ